jgi:hypothetical protein
MFPILCGLLVAIGSVDDTPILVGQGHEWYEKDKTLAQELEGILEYQPGTGRIGIPEGYQPFRIVRQEKESGRVIRQIVYAPGAESLLAQKVGQRVKIVAKQIARGEGENKQVELWLGKLTALGVAPVNAFSELKPLARTNRFASNIVRPINELNTIVMRSGADVAKALGMSGAGTDREASEILAKMLGVKSIDWKKEMVVHLAMLYRNNLGVGNAIEVTHLEVHDRGVIVHWKTEQAVRRGGPSALNETVLVPRVDGEVTFKKVESKPEPARDSRPSETKVAPRTVK